MKFVNLSSLLRESSETDNLLTLVASKGVSLDFVTVETSGNIDSYDTSNEACFRFTNATAIRGLSGGRDGKTIFIYNATGSNLTLTNQSSSPSASYRIITGTGSNIIINNGSGIILQYDGADSRWKSPSIGKSFPSGDIVGTTDSQTLTNKTIEDIVLTKDISITSTSTITTSGSITSLTTADISVIRYNSTSQGTLHGLADGIDGKILIINNINTGKLLIASDSSTETTATNRILTQGDVNLNLRNKSSMILQYDGTSSRWRVLNRYAHNDSSEMQGGDGTNYYHSNQPINTTDTVQFAGLNINGEYSLPTSDGTNGQSLVTNGSGTLTFENVGLVYSNYNYGNISSSSNLDLSLLLYNGYFTHTNSNSSVITLINGTVGKTYKIIGNSNGIQYSFTSSGTIKWPTGITPIISVNGKSDLFVFECVGTNKYVGYYFYNYDSSGLF
jgi:hypothetical protein